MRTFLMWFLLPAAALFLIVALTQPEPALIGPATNRIVSITDCGQLQDEFDIAAANNDRAQPGTAQHKITLSYMIAADEAMEANGCY